MLVAPFNGTTQKKNTSHDGLCTAEPGRCHSKRRAHNLLLLKLTRTFILVFADPYRSVCRYLVTHIHIYVCLCIYVYVCIRRMYSYFSVYLCMYLSICLTTCLYLFIYLLSLCVRVSIYTGLLQSEALHLILLIVGVCQKSPKKPPACKSPGCESCPGLSKTSWVPQLPPSILPPPKVRP